MSALPLLRRMWDHAEWADARLWEALAASPAGDAWREYLHVLGAEETWLARIENRAPRCAVWPELDLHAAGALRDHVFAAYRAYFGTLGPDALNREVHYTNSAGRSFTNTTADILGHVMLHGQYHRGKINLMLRRDAGAPVPVDFIAFVRGSPAATRTPPA